VRHRARIPARLLHAQARERDGEAGRPGHAVGKQRQPANQLFRPLVHHRALFGVEDVERAQQAVHHGMRAAGRDRGGDKREDDGTDGRVLRDGH